MTEKEEQKNYRPCRITPVQSPVNLEISPSVPPHMLDILARVDSESKRARIIRSEWNLPRK